VDPIRRTETWFSRNGLPQFVDDYNSREHIWTRALPAMLAVIVVELVGSLSFAMSSGGRILPVVGAVAAGLAVLGMGLWSKFKRGYWFAPADRVRWPVFAGFMLAGVLSELLQFGKAVDGETISWFSVSFALVIQALLLAAIYVITRFALLSMIGWGIRQTVKSASDLYVVATKALPLLLIVMIVLFINTEMWQVAGSLDSTLLWSSAGLLLVLGVLVTLERTNDQVRELDPAAAIDHVRASCAGTPLAGQADRLTAVGGPDLRRPQRRNLLIAAMFTQLVQAALIGMLVFAFFLVFGMVAITVPVQQTWMGDLGSADVFWTIGQDHALSRALVRVSTFLGAFAAFYVTIYASSDPVYRASFSEDTGASLQQAVNVRRVYLQVKNGA
jgi:hypothetical protein